MPNVRHPRSTLVLELASALHDARRDAGRDYVQRGVAAYTDRAQLLDDLALLLELATPRIGARSSSVCTLAELTGLWHDGAIAAAGPDARLTPAGVRASARAAERRGIDLLELAVEAAR